MQVQVVPLVSLAQTTLTLHFIERSQESSTIRKLGWQPRAGKINSPDQLGLESGSIYSQADHVGSLWLQDKLR